ncbi:MAG: hypothetical protein WC538_23620 [Thermoanaerobaculia bacterium]|jgi:hypothetical protein
MSNFSVFIIESVQPDDLLVGRTEGRLLQAGLALIGLQCEYRLAVDPSTLGKSIGQFLRHAQASESFPILHLSVHGNEDGIVLTSGVHFDWQSLRELLLPVNRVLGGNLFLSLSACHGASGCQMAMSTETDLPYRGLLSHFGPVGFADAAVAYTVFYHRLAMDARFDGAITSMRAAVDDQNFALLQGDETQKLFQTKFKRAIAEIQAAEQQVQARAEAAEPPTPPEAAV